MSLKLALALSTALVTAAGVAPAMAHGYGGGGGYYRFDRDIARDRADLRRDWWQLARLRHLARQYGEYAQRARYYGDWRAARRYEELRFETLIRIRYLERDIRRDRRDLRRDRFGYDRY